MLTPLRKSSAYPIPSSMDYLLFESIFIDVLNTHAPVMTKALKETIMTDLDKKCLLDISK